MTPNLDDLYAILRNWPIGKGPQSYGDFSHAYQARTGVWFEPHGSWDKPLGDLNNRLAVIGAPALSALVILKEANELGGKFWDCAPNVPRRPSNEMERYRGRGECLPLARESSRLTAFMKTRAPNECVYRIGEKSARFPVNSSLDRRHLKILTRAVYPTRRGYGVKFLERGNTMTKLLERAVEKVRKLPDLEQDAIAAIILEELEDEARWQKLFAHSQDALAKLAQEAMAEDKAGKTKELDPDAL